MLRVQLQLSARFSSKFSAAFSVQNSYDQFKTRYDGNTTSDQKLSVNKTTLLLNGYYSFSELIQLGFMPQVSIFRRDVNESVKQTDWLPGVLGSLSIRPHSRSFIGFELSYSISSPGSSICNDLILRQTELKWIEGNPGIKPMDTFDANLNFNWMPLRWMSMNVYVRDIVRCNQYYLSYRPGGETYEGVIGKYINGLRENNLQSFISFSFKPLGGALSIYARMEHCYSSVKGVKSVHQFRPQASISWYFSDFSLYAGCYGPENYFVNGGTGRVKTGWGYDFRLDYGNGNLICSLEANNIFNKYRLTKTLIDNGPFHSRQFDWERGQNVRVSVTYYFDYGKKVTPSIEIQGLETGNSSILGSK